MARNPVERNTWRIRLGLPLVQTAIIMGEAGLVAAPVLHLLNVPNEGSWLLTVMAGTALVFSWQKFVNPGKVQRTAAPMQQRAQEVRWLATSGNAQTGTKLFGRLPIEDKARWKVFCYKLVYENAPLTLNTWTSNKGNPNPFFAPREYATVIELLSSFSLIQRRYPKNPKSEKVLTEKGRAYCQMSSRVRSFVISPQEFEYYYAGIPSPSLVRSMQNELGKMPVVSERTNERTITGAMGRGAYAD